MEKLESLTLTPLEKDIISNRGFLFKKVITVSDVLISGILSTSFIGSFFILTSLVVIIPIVLILGSDGKGEPLWVTGIFLIICFLYVTYILFLVWTGIIFRNAFITDSFILAGGRIYKTGEFSILPYIALSILKIEDFIFKNAEGSYYKGIYYDQSATTGFVIILMVTFGLPAIGMLFYTAYHDIMINYFISLVYIKYYLFGFILTYIISFFLQLFHPFYTFGNLGEKIQSLTPTIEEKSKQIQSEFQSEMNYSNLSNGLDSLSSNFSKIIQFIIRLENAEKRANKGNLFDSEKYINSLRSDIVTPLISLKTFLEEKKIELIQSKQELTRVQVGGTEESGNIELQAKRSDPLILVLTENIEKLDVMIGKMG